MQSVLLCSLLYKKNTKPKLCQFVSKYLLKIAIMSNLTYTEVCQSSLPEPFRKFKERSYWHSKLLDILYIIGVVEVVHICDPLIISL
jgi:hypothetical protein